MATPNPCDAKVWIEPMAIDSYEARATGHKTKNGERVAHQEAMVKEILKYGEFYKNETFPGKNAFYCKANDKIYKGFKPNGELRIVSIMQYDQLKTRLDGCEKIDVATWYPELQKYRDLEGRIGMGE